MKFYQWYSKALGSILGLISCIYCYVRGDLLLYSNLSGNYDTINFAQVLASYLLYPLCLLTLIITTITYILFIRNNNKPINVKLKNFNNTLLYTTSIIGCLGCSIYFIIPAILLLLDNIILAFNHFSPKHTEGEIEEAPSINNNKEPEIENTINQHLHTKTEIALHLINKNANIDFICDVTGFSKEYIDKIKDEALDIHNE